LKLYEAQNIIKDVFENKFDKEKYAYFIRNLLKNLEPKPFGNDGAYKGNLIPRAFQSVIRKMERIGKYEDEEGNMIDVLVVELNREHSIEYARTSQRNFIRWYLNGSRGNEFKDAALVAFHTQKSTDWRFSLIKMQYSLKKGKDILTPAKRSSFLVGEQGKSHTAQQQLVPLLKKDSPPYLSDLEEAFNIEAVSDEFYKKYKVQIFNLKEELDKIVEKDSIIKTEFEQKDIDTLNFAKKLLGQIVFLYFLQKKGWLGLKEGKSYGEGDRNFMRNLFEQAKAKGKNFFNDYLEFLFYDALSQKHTTDFYEKFNCRIPFLNGGLFDPINFYDWQKTDIIIPNELFANKTDDDEEGTGILDIFDLYNFTVKEDEPLEKEVAIDPEMLGKVFERILDVKERKSKGAFYTPREIVHYMAQQSLLYYLESHLNKTISYEKLNSDELEIFGNEVKNGQLDLIIENRELVVPKENLEKFIHYGEHIIDKDIAIEEGLYSANSNKYEVPESIRTNAEAIDKALENIKICDPAVGSGAFPVGVMNEIVKLRNLLTPFIKNKTNRDSYLFKANAIQNSIYGVDIDAGAVEIAKLRLWLSLVVDESNINRIDPLPNLEYKIVQGNSLINMPGDFFRNSSLENEIEKLITKYYKITDKEEKQEQKKNIDTKIQQLLKSTSDLTKYEIDFDFKLYFHEVFNKNNGFDVVIGNPPYIQLQKAFNEKQKYADLYKRQSFKTFERTGDIYTLFYEKGLEILPEGRFLTYITSNKWMRANYGISLRRFFSQKNPLLLLDLGPGIFSSATVDTNILLIENTQNFEVLKAVTLNKPIEDLKKENFVTLSKLSEESWIILSPQEQKIKERIEKIGTPLKDWDINIYRGVLTGYNEAFIIDGKTKDKLIAKDPKSAEIIKPILRGRDIKRYKAEFADLWLINTHNGYKKNSPLLEGCQTKSDGVLSYGANKGIYETYRKLPFNPKLKERAKKLRKAGNLSEVLFWNQVKQKKLLSLDFHRQKIIGNYIVDFYCPALDLVVEIDGKSHDFKVEYDKIRDDFLKSLGLTIIHYADIEIKHNLNSVMISLEHYCKSLLDKKNTPSSYGSHPSKRGELYTAPINIDNYPAIKEHLDQYWDKLEKRQDKGITPYNLRNCAYIEEFEKEKIVFQEMVQESSFLYDNKNNYFCNDTGRIITGKDIKFLVSVLNSNLFFYAIKYFYGGGGLGSNGVRMKHTFFGSFSIPKISKLAQKPYETLVDTIIAKKERGEDTTVEEQQIDVMVYKLYDLTYDEVKIIDPEFELTKKEYNNYV